MQLQSDWSRPLPQRIVIPTVATLTTLADALDNRRARTVDQMARDHRAHMDKVYADHDAMLEQEWRRKG